MTALIDLGEEHAPADDDPPGAPRLSLWQRRWTGLAVCVALLLAAVATERLPPGPLRGPVHIQDALVGSVALVDDLLLLARRREDGGRDLAAVDTRDGRQRWRIPLQGGSPEVYGAWAADGVLLVSVLDGSAAERPWSTYAVDRQTGLLYWRDASIAVGTRIDGGQPVTLMVGVDPAADWFVSRDVRTGRELWRVSYTTGQDWSLYEVGGRIAGFVLVDMGQRRRVRVVGADGTTRAERELPADTGAVQQADGALLVSYEDKGVPRVASLRLPGLEPGWDVPNPARRSSVYVSDCRPSVCVNDGDLLWLLDAATGGVRWYGRMDGFFPAAPGVLNAGIHDTPGYSLLRDSATGEVLVRLRDWQVVGYDGRLLLLSNQQSRRTWFGTFDPARPGPVRVLGAGGPTLDRCWLTQGTVACRALLGGLDVYRYLP
ncbi:PQQ-binding-like beta-propeller repeat protein [Catellatospora sp. KI3]|uniref:PQQ-binding-like beta-propeller repeat protein n=1 Tax=Catellatospora sp. KI3 TaxID=3041620 RepID=UPI002482273C|nr:PQQ-binding-like beta-propeller repeat protein [Catellatospora sp. KI3]MDI1464958.1 PQQ-binding-like beta-propeller repeat protein [Catellatospora sp. KI3]